MKANKVSTEATAYEEDIYIRNEKGREENIKEGFFKSVDKAGEISEAFEASPESIQKFQSWDREKVYITVKPGQKVMFTLDKLKDLDKSGEYIQDKSDVSRLPRKIEDELEEDLLSIEWSSTGGQFLDKRQSIEKAWQAPGAAGKCTVSICLDDLGLARPPNTGNRKDSGTKDITVFVTIE